MDSQSAQGLGDLHVALDFKASRRVRDVDLKGLRALLDEQRPRCAFLVSREEVPRKTEDGIEILPWPMFCEMLWGGSII